MTYILTTTEASNVLRCSIDDSNMLALLPMVDGFIVQATGHDWAVDNPIREEAKSAARMLLVRWHEDPGGMAAGSALGFGLSACLVQLEALALCYQEFFGRDGTGACVLSRATKGDTVSSLVGMIGATGDQSDDFEEVITVSREIQQISSADLSENVYRALLIPPGAL
jgi:hypothetical protein